VARPAGAGAGGVTFDGMTLTVTDRPNRFTQRCGRCNWRVLPGEGVLVRVKVGGHQWWQVEHAECAEQTRREWQTEGGGNDERGIQANRGDAWS